MQVSIRTPSGLETVELKTQQIRLASPLSLLEVRCENGEHCEVQLEKEFEECPAGVNTFRIIPNKRNQRSIKMKHDSSIYNIQFQYAGANVFGEHDVVNLMHFQNSVKSLSTDGGNAWSINTLFDAIECGEVTLLSVIKPLTGYDNKSLLDKLESALTQKVRAICSSPKQGIRTDELVQDVSMVKRINTNTLTHLASHTEHWRTRTLSGLIPKRLKADVIEDETNIYENLFFRMAIDDIADYTTAQILSLKRAKEQNSTAISWEEYGTQINDSKRSILLQKLLPGRNKAELNKENNLFDEALNRWMNISKILVSIRSSAFYKKIDRKRRIGKNIHLTNILKNDQRYKALYDIWCLIRKEQQKEQKQKQGVSDDIANAAENYYFTYTSLSLLYSMHLLGIQFDDNSSFSFSSKDELEVSAYGADECFKYTVTNGVNEYGISVLRITMTECVDVTYPLKIKWMFDRDKLKQLEELITIHTTDNTISFHKNPSSTELTALRDLVHVRQSELRKMKREEQDKYKYCSNVWQEFLSSLAADENLHNPSKKVLSIVPLFYRSASDVAAIEKMSDELLSCSNQYCCYLLANSMDDYKQMKKPHLLRRLFNYGEAFYESDNDKWKDYQSAILPVTQTDIGSIQRMMKYVSLHRSIMTMKMEENHHVHCPVCESKHISLNGTDSWKCGNEDCGIEWGKTRCTKGCGQYFYWVKPDRVFKKDDIEQREESPCEFILRKDSLFDRYIITEFEFEEMDHSSLKSIPVCPKCGSRRFEIC